MKVTRWVCIPLMLMFTVSLTSCAGDYKAYVEAIKEQQITLRLQEEKKESKAREEQNQHEQKMLALTEKLMTAVSNTPDNSDNVLAPILVIVMEDKWSQTKANSLSKEAKPYMPEVKAPETFGEAVQKTGSTLLGGLGLYLGIRQSDNMADVAKAGIKNAGTHNTANNGGVINTGKLDESSLSGSSSNSTETNANSHNTTTTTVNEGNTTNN